MFPSDSGNIRAMADDLKRLGKLVQARRIELGYSTREKFVEQLGFSYRVLTDLENGNRKLGSASYRDVETALRWATGSIDEVLLGSDPIEAKTNRGKTTGDISTESPVGPDTPNKSVDVKTTLIEQGWTEVEDLVSAVRALDDPPEGLLAASRRIVFTMSGYLIIGILESGNAVRFERWLARIYREREQWYRELTTGTPEFPWADSALSNEDFAAEVARHAIHDSRQQVTQVSNVQRDSDTAHTRKSFDDSTSLPKPNPGRRLDISRTPESDSTNVLRISYTGDSSEPPTSNVSEEVEDLPAAARRGTGKTKGEQLRDQHTQLGEESQDPGDHDNGGR